MGAERKTGLEPVIRNRVRSAPSAFATVVSTCYAASHDALAGRRCGAESSHERITEALAERLDEVPPANGIERGLSLT